MEVTQESVREKYVKRLERERQDWIAKVVGVPSAVLSRFKSGKKELWEDSLNKLNDYLDGKFDSELKDL